MTLIETAPDRTVEPGWSQDGQPWADRVRQMGRTVWLAACAAARWAGVWLVHAARCVLVLALVCEVGVKWPQLCERRQLARREEKRRTGRDGTARTRRVDVPRLSRWQVGPHGASVEVRPRVGQDIDNIAELAPALARTLRIQSCKVREVPEGKRQGNVQLEMLRRDPLSRVLLVPHMAGPDRVIFGLDEYGRPCGHDFAAEPHLLITGATNSGKSGYLAALLAGLCRTDDQIIAWDLKYGLEAQLFEARCSEIATTRQQVADSAERIFALAEARAGLLQQHGCRSVPELEELLGIRLRRVRIVVDEVAELALASLTPAQKEAAEATAEEVMNQILRMVQTVRALGINLIVCGQRFGSDLGKGVTSVRAQITGRVCLKVNDKETAQMVLSGLDPQVHSRAMTLHRPGMGIAKQGQEWSYRRATFQSSAQLRTLAGQTAHRVLPLDQVSIDDQARVNGAYGERTR